MARHQLRKITLGEMRAARARNVLVCCSEITCAHAIAFCADPLPDDISLSDFRATLAVLALREQKR